MITCPSGTTVPFPNARENGNLFLTISLIVVKCYQNPILILEQRVFLLTMEAYRYIRKPANTSRTQHKARLPLQHAVSNCSPRWAMTSLDVWASHGREVSLSRGWC